MPVALARALVRLALHSQAVLISGALAIRRHHSFEQPRQIFRAQLLSFPLPIGVQIIGPEYADRITIGVARLLEAEGFAFTPPPGFA